MSLKNQTINAVFWSMLEKFSTLFIQLITTLIIARSIGPNNFGLVGMLSIFMAVGQIILDSGFGQALIRKDKVTNLDYSSVFYFNIFIGVFLYFVLFNSAPYIAHFFNSPSLEIIAKVQFLVFPINALSLIHFTILNKNIDFKSLAKVTSLSAFLSGIIGILLALYYKSVWALVFQNLTFYIFRTILFWIFNKWRPLLKFSFGSIKNIGRFSANLLLTGLVGSIFNNVYHIVIGRYYNATQLGYYSQADRFQKIPSTSVTDVVQRVTYPIFSMLKDDNIKLRSSFLRVINITFYIILPIMVFLMIIAQPLFDILLSDTWSTSARYFRLLCIVGILYPLSCISLNIISVKGEGKLMVYLEIARKILLMFILFVTYSYDMIILMYGLVVYSFLQFLLNSYYSLRLINLGILDLFNCIYSTILTSLISSFTVYFISLLIQEFILFKYILLAIQFLMFSILFLIISYTFKISGYVELNQIIKSKLVNNNISFNNLKRF